MTLKCSLFEEKGPSGTLDFGPFGPKRTGDL